MSDVPIKRDAGRRLVADLCPAARDADDTTWPISGSAREVGGEPRRPGDRRPRERDAFVGDDAHVEAAGAEQVGEGIEQAARQEQHVEQQRADHGHAGHRQGVRTR